MYEDMWGLIQRWYPVPGGKLHLLFALGYYAAGEASLSGSGDLSLNLRLDPV